MKTFSPSALVVAATSLLLGACGPGAAHVRPTGPVTDPNVLFPMGAGYVWNYNVDTGTGLPSLANIRVTESDGTTFTVAAMNAADGGTVYERTPEGILRAQSHTFLLRGPIRLGGEWPSTSGRTARVTSVTATAHTNEGDLTGCVEVTEAGGESQLSIRTVYCPDVGPAIIETTQTLTLSPQPVRVTATLLGHSFGGTDGE